MTARPGDHLLCPFECDTCQFLKIFNRAPKVNKDHDTRVMAFIRRACLDAFWAREPSTVSGHVRSVGELVLAGDDLDMPILPAIGPWPSDYDHGMRGAVAILRKSLAIGWHEPTVKFATLRKMRTTLSNLWKASAQGNVGTKFFRLSQKRGIMAESPYDSEWFVRFMAGLENRLGQHTKQDAAISIAVMHKLMHLFEEEYQSTVGNLMARRRCVEAACFSLFSFCSAARGFEIPKLVLHYLKEFRQPEWRGGVGPHVGLPMAGRFKLRGNMDQNLLLFVAAETASGLKPLLWTNRLVDALAQCGIESGWAFQWEDGKQARMSDYEEVIFSKLEEIQANTSLIDKEINIREEFGLARSFRRGSTTEAQNKQVAQSDIDWIARWNSKKAGVDERTPYFQGEMRIHYADQKQMTVTLLRFSQAL